MAEEGDEDDVVKDAAITKAGPHWESNTPDSDREGVNQGGEEVAERESSPENDLPASTPCNRG